MNAKYRIVKQTDAYVLIQDVGHTIGHMTITNDAENVVADIDPLLHGRRLEYIDSDGNRDQLIVVDGQFAGFAPVP